MDKFKVIVDGKELECVLNAKNETTKRIVHILVTTLCARHCKYCCNRLCDKNKIDYVTNEELSECETVCITGGEPFLFSNPNAIAKYYKANFKNIKRVYVYTNADELEDYLINNGKLDYIDGLCVSIKTPEDVVAFDLTISSDDDVLALKSNICYYFENLKPGTKGNFYVGAREWQTLEEYKPNPDSIFRKA